MVQTIALIENGIHQIGAGSGVVLMLETSNFELKKDKFWIEFDDSDKNYIVSNKTNNTTERVDSLDLVANIICTDYSKCNLDEYENIQF